MGHSDPTFTIGIEEEYLLVDKKTRALAVDPPDSMLRKCKQLFKDQISPEFLRAQIEIGTRVCRTLEEARWELTRLRKVIVDVANEYDMAPIAASTHPFATWGEQKYTEKDRYRVLEKEMQAAARRLVICGMHVHVGIEDDELRIDLLNQFAYFLPHLLAMSCSSPFWRGENTGLMSYRLTVFDALPRTGLPQRFTSFAEYTRHVNVLVNAGLIPDASKIWWDMRPSSRYPTLETRVMDVCTDLEDALSLAALVVCILRMLYRLRLANKRWRNYNRMLLNENRWRAMRYSFDQGLLDLAKGQLVPVPDLIDELLELIRDDADAIGCLDEVVRCRDIFARGTSAHHQLRVYKDAIEKGAEQHDALCQVVDYLIEETAKGL
ncbi:MAG: carboxylate-amine ligase [Gammaproteobacteria bacterium]|nr:carboxylate-amine ligase [Gammaproteobacteria bacterium]MCZ6717187.1 carboxylate-amine ligase [Gammaproteobacteria bacterium]